MTTAKQDSTGGGELVPISDFAISTIEGDASAIMAENMGQGGMTVFDLDKVKVPAGGARIWSVPGITGDDDVRELVGVIVAWREPRAFWATSLDERGTGGNVPPDCSSDDGVVGRGEYGPGSADNPSGACAVCPMSEWGSKEGTRAQACKQMRLLFLLRPDDLLPLAVFLPPTSIGPIRRYFMRLASKGIPYYGVLTKLTLEKVTNATGIDYARVEPEMIGRLSAADRDAVREYGTSIKDALEGVSVTAEDVDG